MSPHIEHNIPKDLLDNDDIVTDDEDEIDTSPSTRPPSRIASGNAPGIFLDGSVWFNLLSSHFYHIESFSIPPSKAHLLNDCFPGAPGAMARPIDDLPRENAGPSHTPVAEASLIDTVVTTTAPQDKTIMTSSYTLAVEARRKSFAALMAGVDINDRVAESFIDRNMKEIEKLKKKK